MECVKYLMFEGIVYRHLMTNEPVQNPPAPILDPKTIQSPFYFEEDIPHLKIEFNTLKTISRMSLFVPILFSFGR